MHCILDMKKFYFAQLTNVCKLQAGVATNGNQMHQKKYSDGVVEMYREQWTEC